MSTALLDAPTAAPASSVRAFSEMRQGPDLNPAYGPIDGWLRATTADLLERKRRAAAEIFRTRGITFTVYGDGAGTERLIPFDVIPRIIARREWAHVHAGCVQRVRALNAFLEDVYGRQEIIRAGVIPAEAVLANTMYRPEAVGLPAMHGVHAHVAGVDLVRTGPDNWFVLEDNLRTPSGVSYMLENRAAMRRLFPEFFRAQRIAPVEHYADLLLAALRDAAPGGVDDPTVVVLTPGAGNSAYFEHAYLAQRMGVRLVEGGDLLVDGDRVFVRTTSGPRPVHVIYRRVDDDFLDPEVFRSDSVLGVPGLLRAARAGNVALANAVGNGVADDKATYLHVPAMIRFYLDEEPLLENVPTWRCADPAECSHVLAHLHELVVKEVHGSGGYGMLIGPAATAAERVAYAERIRANPGEFIAQPTLALSTCPTFVAQGIAPRHVDLRPYVVSGKSIALVPGALTRVALKEGSLVVNSSQGGGTKDTWIVD